MVPMPLKAAAELQGSPAAVWLSWSCSGEYRLWCYDELQPQADNAGPPAHDATDRIISPLDLKMITGRRIQAQRRLYLYNCRPRGRLLSLALESLRSWPG